MADLQALRTLDDVRDFIREGWTRSPFRARKRASPSSGVRRSPRTSRERPTGASEHARSGKAKRKRGLPRA
jgi:hypothetical protein